jgi:hypothetical protein
VNEKFPKRDHVPDNYASKREQKRVERQKLDARVCPACGADMYDVDCKLQCSNYVDCGYFVSCSE